MLKEIKQFIKKCVAAGGGVARRLAADFPIDIVGLFMVFKWYYLSMISGFALLSSDRVESGGFQRLTNKTKLPVLPGILANAPKEYKMSLTTDILGLSETGWTVKSTNRFLIKAAPGIAVGGGHIEAEFVANGKPVGISGRVIGYGVGAGVSFSLGKELIRSIVKYANVFKFASLKSNLYRYALTNNDPPTVEGLKACDLVLTTIGGNAVILGGSLDYYAFYRKGEPNTPRWVWFAAGAEVSGGGSGGMMQYKSDGMMVRTG
ncbi:MAG: hypothetical protein R6X17_04310 [Candidatus Competibacteraceae bacterium]